MAKKKNWFDRIKRFFGSDTKSKQQKKDKRKRWFLGRFKSKCLPALPPQHEQSKHAVAAAVSTAVAAEAAVAAAQSAFQVVRLAGAPLPHHRSQEVAAIRVQAAFRGYLARSALRALKGLVKLQALIRGQTVRRQTTATYKGLQSLINIQSQARASRVKALLDSQAHDIEDMAHIRTKNSELMKASPQRNIGRNWDCSTLSKDEMITLLKNRREAAIKRERAMEYASSYQDQRRPSTPVHEELNPDIEDRRWSWLEEWVGVRPLDRDHHMKVRAEESRVKFTAKGSFNRSRRTSFKDDVSFSRSPTLPSYMASTACANARFRSLSTPKQRSRNIDACSEYCVPFADRILSPLPSTVSDAGLSKISKSQKSPLVKTRTGPVKCNLTSDHHSFDSECSSFKWDRLNACR